jgi:ribosome biogenesis protein ERB1
MGKKNSAQAKKMEESSSSEEEDYSGSSGEGSGSGGESEDDDDEDNEDDEDVSSDDDNEFVDHSDDSDSGESLNIISGSEVEDSEDEEQDQEEEKTREIEDQQRSFERSMQTRGKTVYGASGPQSAYARHIDADDLSSDDEEGEKNTVGRIPLHWYDAYDHIGYDVNGKKVAKQNGIGKMEQAIANRDDPASRRTIYDMYNDQEVVLSKRDMEIIRRMQAGAFAHPEHNDTPDYVPYFSSIIEPMPIMALPEPKRRFIPSKWDTMRVVKIAKAIKEGRYKTLAQILEEKNFNKNGDPKKNMAVWADAEEDILAESAMQHLPAPKMALPGHAESYNPPPEYLLSEEERKKEEELDNEDKKYNFIPKAHTCLRHVAGYDNFVRERFERCLDLYLCPRKLKRRLNIDPETLLPRLPRPRELKPYPNTLCLQYLGHKKAIRQVCISPDGQYMASCSDDGTVRLWEIDTCLCRNVWKIGGSSGSGSGVIALAWNPNASHCILAAATANKVVLIATGTGDEDSTDMTEALLTAAEESANANGLSGGDDDGGKMAEDDSDDDEGVLPMSRATLDKANEDIGNKAVCKWFMVKSSSDAVDADLFAERHGAVVGPRLELHLKGEVSKISWHHKGDYLSTLTPTCGPKSLAVHQISKAKTQTPFTKSPGRIQDMKFHPVRPFLFIMTQQNIKIYNLVEQKLIKKLNSNCKYLSSIVIHPSGDHLLVGSYDRRVVWFDLDLGSTPYKTLKYHEKAVRDVTFHLRYPLMASCSDDGNIHVFHSTVYTDLERNPMIVPLKVLRGHKSANSTKGEMGATTLAFHPYQPWIISAGADGVINMFQDI